MIKTTYLEFSILLLNFKYIKILQKKSTFSVYVRMKPIYLISLEVGSFVDASISQAWNKRTRVQCEMVHVLTHCTRIQQADKYQIISNKHRLLIRLFTPNTLVWLFHKLTSTKSDNEKANLKNNEELLAWLLAILN